MHAEHGGRDPGFRGANGGEGEDHLEVVQPPALDGIFRWLSERLAGKPMEGCWEGPVA